MNQTTAQTASQEANEASDTGDIHFLAAWIQAVNLIGPRSFGCMARTPDTATHPHQLTPKLDVIRKSFPNKSKHDAVFVAAVASLYNASEGQKLLNKVGCSFGDMALVLKPQQRAILSDLFLHYRGW